MPTIHESIDVHVPVRTAYDQWTQFEEPDRRIGWQSTSGAKNGGVVRVEPLASDSTRVDLTLDAEPEGPVESVGTALHVVQAQVNGDLDRFKQFIENRGEETGAWRHRIEAGLPTAASA